MQVRTGCFEPPPPFDRRQRIGQPRFPLPADQYPAHPAPLQLGLRQVEKALTHCRRAEHPRAIVDPRQVDVEQQVEVGGPLPGVEPAIARAEQHVGPYRRHQWIGVEEQRISARGKRALRHRGVGLRNRHQIGHREINPAPLGKGAAIFRHEHRVIMARQLLDQRRLARAFGAVEADGADHAAS